MLKILIYQFVLLIWCLVPSDAGFAGDTCIKDGTAGTCTNIISCASARNDLKNRRLPQICSFDGSNPIVCCFDAAVTTVPPPVPLLTTTQRSVRPPSPTPEPPTYEYEEECEDIPQDMTANKTGQKAFDKCIEYQEQYVYPCERSVALVGGMSRRNNCHHNANELIIGGSDCARNEFPHMAMLGYGEDEQNIAWLCGGTIISERYILTAGHCTASRDKGNVTYVLVGALMRDEEVTVTRRYKIKRSVRHPDFRPPNKYNDIALLETDNIMKLNQYVLPACLHVGDPVEDDRVLAIGWGLTQYKGSLSDILQKVILHKFTKEECDVKYPVHRLMRMGLDPETQTCYGDKTQSKDTCQGDSGGPIQIKSKRLHCMYVIVGVTSFGRGCGFPGEPAIYTRVAHYVPWIESIVWP